MGPLEGDSRVGVASKHNVAFFAAPQFSVLAVLETRPYASDVVARPGCAMDMNKFQNCDNVTFADDGAVSGMARQSISWLAGGQPGSPQIVYVLVASVAGR